LNGEGASLIASIIRSMTSQERMMAVLSATFGVLAVLLAAVGLYGVMAYGVSQRTGELGIRMALGARPADVRRLVLKETLQLILAGAAIGTAAALGLTRLVSAMLFGVKATDFTVFGASILLLGAIAFLAGYLPARRASRIDPMVALRHE
jgi:ABC-type antimicrobial peptide transport system permease subunit